MPLYQKVTYTGKLSEYQKFPKRFTSQVIYEQDRFNAYQNFLYKRALFGLSVYSKEEIDAMHYAKKKRIAGVHLRAQKVLNICKKENIIEKLIQERILPSNFYELR